MASVIDINADLGETVEGVPTADDEAMFPLVSSASIACGGHAGDADSMREAVARAHRVGTAVGAHPSFPDTENFGRVRMRIDSAELRRSLDAQLDALVAAGARLSYVKAHGALYNACHDDAELAGVVAAAVAGCSERIGQSLPVLGLGGRLERAAADAGLPFVREGFLDRGYTPAATLVPRTDADALLQDARAVAARAVTMAREGVVQAVDGTWVRVDAASLCVHGDTPAAVAMARAVREALHVAGIEVRAPW